MEIEGKDFMDWLHDVRGKMQKEQKEKGLDDTEWTKKMTLEAEKIINRTIPTIDTIKPPYKQ